LVYAGNVTSSNHNDAKKKAKLVSKKFLCNKYELLGNLNSPTG